MKLQMKTNLIITLAVFVLIANHGVENTTKFYNQLYNLKYMTPNLKKIELYPTGTIIPHKTKGTTGVYYPYEKKIKLIVDKFGNTALYHELKHHMCFETRNRKTYCIEHFEVK